MGMEAGKLRLGAGPRHAPLAIGDVSDSEDVLAEIFSRELDSRFITSTVKFKERGAKKKRKFIREIVRDDLRRQFASGQAGAGARRNALATCRAENIRRRK